MILATIKMPNKAGVMITKFIFLKTAKEQLGHLNYKDDLVRIWKSEGAFMAKKEPDFIKKPGTQTIRSRLYSQREDAKERE